MEQKKTSMSPEKMVYVWIGVGILLAIAFIVIGSVFFDLKPGPTASDSTSSDQIDPSLYAPSN
ncbi:hypothetical protein HYV71_01185 [Candidatus Uhrbacteria bacterium]|nr:hypothetical protein [Candidatus Uhrbacteria bacterium]